MKLSRRTFIKQSAVASSAMFLSSSFAGEAIAKRKNIGFQVWSIAKNLQNDFDGSLRLLSQVGYKQIELFGPYPFSTEKDKASWNAITPLIGFNQSGYFGKTAKEFNQVLKDHGLRTPAMHIGLDTLRNNMAGIAEATHELGQKYVGIASIPKEERGTLDDYKRIADDFNKIGEKAKANGFHFYYHNHGYGLSPVDGIIPFDLIMQRTDPTLVFFEMDLFWTIAGGADPIKYFKAHPGRFKLIHIKDMKQKVRFSGDGSDPTQWIELFPNITDAGSGVLDLKSILASAKESGVEHFIAENDVITNPKESLEKAYLYLSSLDIWR